MASDNYTLPNGVLKNKFGVTTQDELERLEADSVAIRLSIITRKEFLPPYSLDTAKFIHGFLFREAYEWAGKLRTCDLAKKIFEDDKGDPVRFTPHSLISKNGKRIFDWLGSRDNLCGLEPDEFAYAIAELFVKINNLHPFREGNGRTQRLLLTKIAANAGYDLAFDVVTHERMVDVSVHGAMGDLDPAIRLFNEILDEDRVRALRKAISALKDHYAHDWQDIYIATTVAGRAYRGILAGKASPDFLMQVKEDREWVAIGNETDLPPDANSGEEIAIIATKWK